MNFTKIKLYKVFTSIFPNYYSKLLLIRSHGTGEVPNYQIFLIIRWYLYQPQSLEVIFLLLFLYFGCTTNHGSIPTFIRWLRAIRVLFCVSTSLHS